jgi:hypothetical protein
MMRTLRTRGRCNSKKKVLRVALSAGGRRGTVTSCAASATSATTSATTKAARQPQRSPIQAPTGAAQTVASETPVKMMAMARGMSAGGTSRRASAADIAQKPPRLMPSRMRENNSTGRFEASAASVFETMSRHVSSHRIRRRSNWDVPTTIAGPAMAPTTAVAVTAWPARPLLIERSRAIGVRMEAGRNSAVTRAKTPSESETMAGQAARRSRRRRLRTPRWNRSWKTSGVVSDREIRTDRLAFTC